LFFSICVTGIGQRKETVVHEYEKAPGTGSSIVLFENLIFVDVLSFSYYFN
jgi:hypothetical protein